MRYIARASTPKLRLVIRISLGEGTLILKSSIEAFQWNVDGIEMKLSIRANEREDARKDASNRDVNMAVNIEWRLFYRSQDAPLEGTVKVLFGADLIVSQDEQPKSFSHIQNSPRSPTRTIGTRYRPRRKNERYK
jgi:hypothetical protein